MLCGVFAGLETDGIYRVSGNLAVIQKLRFLVNHGEDEGSLAVPSVRTAGANHRLSLNGLDFIVSCCFSPIVNCFIHANTHELSPPPPPHEWPPECKLLLPTERAVTTDGRYMFPADLVQGSSQAGWKNKKNKQIKIQLSRVVLSNGSALLPH